MTKLVFYLSRMRRWLDGISSWSRSRYDRLKRDGLKWWEWVGARMNRSFCHWSGILWFCLSRMRKCCFLWLKQRWDCFLSFWWWLLAECDFCLWRPFQVIFFSSRWRWLNLRSWPGADVHRGECCSSWLVFGGSWFLRNKRNILLISKWWTSCFFWLLTRTWQYFILGRR